jgi:hypothetical protein
VLPPLTRLPTRSFGYPTRVTSTDRKKPVSLVTWEGSWRRGKVFGGSSPTPTRRFFTDLLRVEHDVFRLDCAVAKTDKAE